MERSVESKLTIYFEELFWVGVFEELDGEKAHSCYFGKDAYANMIKDSKYADNKELYIIEDAVHTDLYDGGGKDAIPLLISWRISLRRF